MAFVDEVRVRARAGRGGRGAASFRSEPFIPRGGPDGGDGGRGGSVILKASRRLEDLAPLQRRNLLKAEDGAPGAGGRKGGRSGADLVVEVPIGTMVFDAGQDRLIADLDREDASAAVAEGGAGGEGNVHRASSTHRAPSTAGPGETGEERDLRLELRLPVDVALVGAPNSGKSALLAALTNARPRVADYPFTTTEPVPGILFSEAGAPVLLLEIPAVDRQRRQLERARAIALVADGREPARLGLDLERPQLVVYTHADEVPKAKRRRSGIWVSTRTGEGLPELRAALLELGRTAPQRDRARPPAGVTRLKEKRPQGEPVKVQRRAWGFEIAGAGIERLLDRYDLDSPDGFDRFQVALDRTGVSDALAEAGAEPGDTVRIGDSEFEYQP